eukprot:scaffold1707_cov88-Cylindrotheca_fusiformis.AAC.6
MRDKWKGAIRKEFGILKTKKVWRNLNWKTIPRKHLKKFKWIYDIDQDGKFQAKFEDGTDSRKMNEDRECANTIAINRKGVGVSNGSYWSIKSC